MKKLFSLLIVLFVAFSTTFAQVPETFKWQGVVRDAGGQISANKLVTISVDIKQFGNKVFQEVFTKTTSQTGQVDILIGSTKSMNYIDWLKNTSFVVYIDGTKVSDSQFSSVPYALKSKSSETVDKVYMKNILDVPLLFSGDYSNLTNKPDLSKFITSVDWNTVLNKPVMFSGDYNSLTNKPVMFSGDYSSLTNKPDLTKFITSVDWNTILNKPVMFDGKYSSLTSLPILFNGDYNKLVNKPDLTKYISVESETIYKTSAAATITTVNIDSWNKASKVSIVTTTLPGYMSTKDKYKLDSLVAKKYYIGDMIDKKNVNTNGRYSSLSLINRTGQAYVFYVDPSGKHGLAASMSIDFTIWASIISQGYGNSGKGDLNTAQNVSLNADGVFALYSGNSSIGVLAPDNMWVASISEVVRVFSVLGHLAAFAVGNDCIWTSNYNPLNKEAFAYTPSVYIRKVVTTGIDECKFDTFTELIKSQHKHIQIYRF